MSTPARQLDLDALYLARTGLALLPDSTVARARRAGLTVATFHPEQSGIARRPGEVAVEAGQAQQIVAAAGITGAGSWPFTAPIGEEEWAGEGEEEGGDEADEEEQR